MAFQAHAQGDQVVGDSAKEAAIKFFQNFPNRRKCNIIEGKADGFFFSVEYGPGCSPRSFKDITKKMIDTLPTS